MARLIVLYNPLDTSRRRSYELPQGTNLDAWLAEHEPLGGSMTRRVWVDGQEITETAYIVGERDEILAAMRPAFLGFSAAVIYQAIATAIISAAISFVLSKVFGPKKPSAGNTPTPSQVYGIAPTRNSARLGELDPRRVREPHRGAGLRGFASYTTFVNNEQFFSAILCIGEGYHEVQEMLMGDSSAAALPSDVASFTVFDPSEHLSTYGVIQAATGVYENVVSSADISDQELLAPNASDSYTPSPWFWATTLVQTTTAIPPGALDMRGMTVDQKLAALPQNPALGTQAVGVISSTGVAPNITYQVVTWTAAVYSSAVEVPPYSLVPPPTATGASFDRWVGPFETCKPGQHGTRIELDFVFSGGLFTMEDNGNLHSRTISRDDRIRERRRRRQCGRRSAHARRDFHGRHQHSATL